jgi:hypothetical protein
MGKFADLTKVSDIVEAYEEQGLPAFAVFHDSQLKVKWCPDSGEGIDEGSEKLEKYLTRLEGSGSYAIYTLRVYDNGGGSIKSNTPYDSSTNFQFNRSRAPGQAGMGSVETSYKGASYTDLAVENALLKKKVEDLEDEIDNPTKGDGGVMGMIDKVAGLPGMDNLIGIVAAKIAQAITGQKGQYIPPQNDYDPQREGHGEGNFAGTRSLSGIPNLDDAKRIDVAISELSKAVPDLPAILEKLSRMSKTQRFKFNLFLSTLRNMQV